MRRTPPAAATFSLHQAWTVGLAGACLLLAGATAVFKAQSEAGPVALIAAGFALLVIGVSRRLPTRIKAGEFEAGWDAAQAAIEVIEDVVQEGPAETTPDLLRRLEDLASEFPELESTRLRHVTMTVRAAVQLAEIANGSGGTFAVAPPDRRRDWDFVVLGANGRQIGILVATGADINRPRLRRDSVRRALERNTGFIGAIIVADSEAEGAMLKQWRNVEDVTVASAGQSSRGVQSIATALDAKLNPADEKLPRQPD